MKCGARILIPFAAIIYLQKMNNSYHSDLTVQGPYYLALLEQWDCGFESRSGEELFFFYVCGMLCK
jgi:hypothetical protein